MDKTVEEKTVVNEKDIQIKPLIKALVFSGGGPAGLISYGAAKHLALADFWQLHNIERMDGCSIGAFLAVALSLNYPFNWLDDYFIERPWEKVIGKHLHLSGLLGDDKGALGTEFIEAMIEPLLTAKGLSLNTTLAHLHEFNHIDVHLYTTNINTSDDISTAKINMSHKTHPDLPVVTALHMSMAVPLAFTPVYDEVKAAMYIDGGLLNNFPVNDCLTQMAPDSILAFKNTWPQEIKSGQVNKESTLVEFLMTIVKKLAAVVDTTALQTPVQFMVECPVINLEGFNNWLSTMSSIESRKELVKRGEEFGQTFLMKL